MRLHYMSSCKQFVCTLSASADSALLVSADSAVSFAGAGAGAVDDVVAMIAVNGLNSDSSPCSYTVAANCSGSDHAICAWVC